MPQMSVTPSRPLAENTSGIVKPCFRTLEISIFWRGRITFPSAAERSTADYVLLDAGAGDGKVFDWSLLENFRRQYFLAGGLDPENAGPAVRTLHPFTVDVSSGIETGGVKDPEKMKAFVSAVRAEGNRSQEERSGS